MNALDRILFSKIETPMEIAIYQLWLKSNKPTDDSDTMFVVAQNAAADLAALRAELTQAQKERDFFRQQFPTAAKNWADAIAKERGQA